MIRFFVGTEIAHARLRDPRKDRQIGAASDNEHGSQQRLVRHASGVRRDTPIPRKEIRFMRLSSEFRRRKPTRAREARK
jgi:hypothetical protein